MNIDDKEIESLGDGFFVAVSKEHRFGTDSFLLSEFSKIKHSDVVADFGTGCGIISILLYKKYRPKKIVAIDILESACFLAKKSVMLSNLKDRIDVVRCDVKKLGTEYNCKFNKIVCNPPYKAIDSGKLSSSKVDKIARHETKLTIDNVCKKAADLLQFQGSLFMSGRVERLSEIVLTMNKYSLEVKTLQFCAKDKNSAPWLFLVEGRKGAKPFLKVLPNFFVN